MDVQSFNYSVLTSGTATALTSGTVVSISGLARDKDFGMVYDVAGNGTFTMYSGQYQNADLGNYTKDVADASIYIMPQLDGSRYRKEDGTVDVMSTASGNLYAWTLA